MPIIFHKNTKEFHLYNDEISYIFCILRNGQPGQIYYGIWRLVLMRVTGHSPWNI